MSDAVTKAAVRVGLHTTESERLEDPLRPTLCATLEYYPSPPGGDEEGIRSVVTR